ncbi:MAG: SpoIIE family protein phosphatase [Bacteroidetes bacterium]|nr:SpoIIE family protein phosphatase [Bacteroidota bacterium]
MDNKSPGLKAESDLLQEMTFLNEITQSISEIKPLDVLLAEIMESSKILVNAEASSLLIYDKTEDVLYFEVATGEKGSEVKKIICKMGEGIAGWVAQNREPLLIEDCYKDPRFNREYDKKTKFKTKTMICVPMIHKEKLIGVIQVINKKNNKVFNERDLILFRILSSQCAIAIENASLLKLQIEQEVLNRELKTARDIQQNLLPEKLPQFNDLDVSAVLIPAKQIGGDYYNVFKISETKTLFLIADVSGKSISAALIVSTIFSAILTYFDQNGSSFDLKDFVNCLNRILIESTTSEKFATAWFGLYDHSAKSLESINAGHNITFVFDKNGNIKELKEGGIFLGCADLEFNSETVTLENQDTVFYFTDGINEAMNREMNQYSDERLVKVLKDNLEKSAGEIVRILLEDIKLFVDGAEQSDDITCGLIKVL